MLARCLLLHKHDLYKQRRLAHMGVKNIAIVFFAASFSHMCRVSKPCALVLFWSPVMWPSSFEVVFFEASFSQLCKGLQTMRSCTVLIPCHVSDTSVSESVRHVWTCRFEQVSLLVCQSNSCTAYFRHLQQLTCVIVNQAENIARTGLLHIYKASMSHRETTLTVCSINNSPSKCLLPESIAVYRSLSWTNY